MIRNHIAVSIRAQHVPQIPQPAGVQVLRRAHHARVHAGHQRDRGAQRLGEVQHRRRDRLGAGGAGPPGPPGRPDGRRDLRRQPGPRGAGNGRGQAGHRQLGRPHPGPHERARDQPGHLPQRGERVPHRGRGLPAAGHPGAPGRDGDRTGHAHGGGAGPAGGRADRPPGGTAPVHRGSGRHRQASPPQGTGAAQAGVAGARSAPAPGRAGGAPQAAASVEATGRNGRSPREAHGPGGGGGVAPGRRSPEDAAREP